MNQYRQLQQILANTFEGKRGRRHQQPPAAVVPAPAPAADAAAVAPVEAPGLGTTPHEDLGHDDGQSDSGLTCYSLEDEAGHYNGEPVAFGAGFAPREEIALDDGESVAFGAESPRNDEDWPLEEGLSVLEEEETVAEVRRGVVELVVASAASEPVAEGDHGMTGVVAEDVPDQAGPELVADEDEGMLDAAAEDLPAAADVDMAGVEDDESRELPLRLK